MKLDFPDAIADDNHEEWVEYDERIVRLALFFSFTNEFITFDTALSAMLICI